MNEGLFKLVKCAKAETCAQEIKLLKANKLIKGRLRYLSPFLDKKRLIRVGGRL